MTLEYPDQKYVTRFDIRAGGEGTLRLTLDYSSANYADGSQELETTITGRNRTFPMRPHRADTVIMTLSGTGSITLASIARILEQGSDYNR